MRRVRLPVPSDRALTVLKWIVVVGVAVSIVGGILAYARLSSRIEVGTRERVELRAANGQLASDVSEQERALLEANRRLRRAGEAPVIVPPRTGPAGAAGPQGLAGSPGLQGPRGIPGLRGPRGFTGLTGAPGIDGASGQEGEAGPTGPAGPTGAKGEQGAEGKTGAKGETGERGLPGEPGAIGATGATGPEGPPGPAGPAGPAGPSCPEGFVGQVITVLTPDDVTREIFACIPA